MPFLTYRLEQISTAAIKAADARYMEAVNLRVRELRVLRLLHEMPNSTPTELLKSLELDKTLLSKNLAALEQKALIVRSADPADNRRQCFSLTEKGTRAWTTAEQIGRKLEAEMFAALSPGQWQSLQQLLNEALASLQDWQRRQG